MAGDPLDTLDTLIDEIYALRPELAAVRNAQPGELLGELAALEGELGAPYPPSFARWCTRDLVHGERPLIDFGRGIGRVCKPSPDVVARLRYEVSNLDGTACAGIGLLPFGDSDNDTGPLCFDTRTPCADGEWPIVELDHEQLDDPDDAVSGVRFSSFSKLLECAAFLARAIDAADRERRLRELSRIDPGPLAQRRIASPSGFREMYANLQLAESLVDTEPAAALHTLDGIDDPSIRIRVAVARARALIGLARSDDAAVIIDSLATEWLAPELPNGANQQLARAEILELLDRVLELLPARAREALRRAVGARAEPTIALSDDDSL